MRTNVALLAVSLCAPFCLASLARGAESYVSGWKITVDEDPFSSKKKTIAMVLSGQNGIMAVRCFPDEGLSVLIIPLDSKREYKADQSIHFKYRADKDNIIEDDAHVFGEHAAAMPNARQILDDAEHAGTLFLRIETPDDTAADLAFKMKGASKALAGIRADCPSDTKEDKANAKKADK